MGCVVPEQIAVTDHDGNQRLEKRKVEAFLVHLGGQLGEDAAFGRKVQRRQGPRIRVGAVRRDVYPPIQVSARHGRDLRALHRATLERGPHRVWREARIHGATTGPHDRRRAQSVVTNLGHPTFATPDVHYAELETADPKGVLTWAASTIDRLGVGNLVPSLRPRDPAPAPRHPPPTCRCSSSKPDSTSRRRCGSRSRSSRCSI